MTEQYDLIVVGGGPSGSTLAALVASQQSRVLLLERERFPRYQIGESLLPATINSVCRLLGIEDKIKNAGFVKKQGGAFRWGVESDYWTFNFTHSGGTADPENDETIYAYEVCRDKFDSILLDNAREKGVDVREEMRVLSLLFKDGRVTGVRYRDLNGKEHVATARYVVDASGHAGGIAGSVGERVRSGFYRNIAIYGYYRNGKRLPAPNDGNVLFEAVDDSWLWYIPLSDSLTSVGVVIPQRHHQILRSNHSAVLEKYIDACPIIRDYLADSRRATGPPYDQVRIRKNFSYCQTKFWIPGMVLIGDSACFIDVLLSSGVHLATYSGILAARSLNTFFRGELDESTCFNEFEIRYRLEFSKFYQLLIGLYDMKQNGKTYQTWLRQWLDDTNAIHLQCSNEKGNLMAQNTNGQPQSGPKLTALRKMNRTMLTSIKSPRRMELIPRLLHLTGCLTTSADGFHWVRS